MNGSQSRSRISCNVARPGQVNSWRRLESLLHSRQCELPFEISIFYAYTWETCRLYLHRRAHGGSSAPDSDPLLRQGVDTSGNFSFFASSMNHDPRGTVYRLISSALDPDSRRTIRVRRKDVHANVSIRLSSSVQQHQWCTLESSKDISFTMFGPTVRGLHFDVVRALPRYRTIPVRDEGSKVANTGDGNNKGNDRGATRHGADARRVFRDS